MEWQQTYTDVDSQPCASRNLVQSLEEWSLHFFTSDVRRPRAPSARAPAARAPSRRPRRPRRLSRRRPTARARRAAAAAAAAAQVTPEGDITVKQWVAFWADLHGNFTDRGFAWDAWMHNSMTYYTPEGRGRRG